MLPLYHIQFQFKNNLEGNSTLIYMIGVILVHVHIIILHNYENEVTYDIYKM